MASDRRSNRTRADSGPGRRCALIAGLALMSGLVAGCTGGAVAMPSASTSKAATPPSPVPSTPAVAPEPLHAPRARPNVIFVLADDLALNLVPYMPHVQALQKAGTTFSNYTVTDSLCCPSRSSIFTGKFPHNTGIFRNTGPDGGFDAFRSRGEESSTFATALKKSGYRTAMMGKYLNGYVPKADLDGTGPYVPPGWTEWVGAGNAGYDEFTYTLNQNRHVVQYGATPADYLTHVVSGRGSKFIEDSVAAGSPFLLEIATFAPHAPYTPAPKDAKRFPGLKAPRTAAYNTLPTDPPPWLAGRKEMKPKKQKQIDTVFRKRVQAVQSVDRMIGSLQKTLKKTGTADDTLIVFSSDNGFHLGEHRLGPGKQTAFDTDVHVPLVVAGPGVPAGWVSPEVVQNIDLAPTFEELAGAKPAADVDGQSLVPLFYGRPEATWRTTALIEHHGPDVDPADPDFPGPGAANPTSYEALRTTAYTYVEYVDGFSEYYDRRTDPDQLHNIAATLPAATRAALKADLARLKVCQGQSACWDAAHARS